MKTSVTVLLVRLLSADTVQRWCSKGCFPPNPLTKLVDLTRLLTSFSQSPSARQKVFEELDRVLPDGRSPSFADTRELKYIMRCINESMRLYPHPPVRKQMLHSAYHVVCPTGFHITRMSRNMDFSMRQSARFSGQKSRAKLRLQLPYLAPLTKSYVAEIHEPFAMQDFQRSRRQFCGRKWRCPQL